MLCLLAHPRCSAAAEESPAVDYLRDIKPILAQRCVACHGPEQQQADLRLDTATGGKTGGVSGPAIVPGQAAASLIIQAITGAEGLTRMPPKDEGPPLAPAEIAALRAWIDAGAPHPDEEPATAAAPRRGSDHWAFQPIGAPSPPALPAEHAPWARNEIDHFVLQTLAAAGLAPSPEADRATLLRRVSLDLIGLPPTREELRAFLLDNRPQAYQEAVDRLLDSPHYGERWGRHWLDLARYADSNGYTIDSGRAIWKYRDWVIAALNRDLPFDQFAIEQLAGDLLPEATLDQRIATGFHRNTMVNEEGGTDPEQFRVEAVADRVATTGAVFLGLTLGCARCHDHKYDPLSQREYYQFFAFFNSADEPKLQVPSDQQARELPGLLAEIEQFEKRLEMVDANLGVRQAEWETTIVGEPEKLAKLPEEIQQILAIPVAERDDEQRKKLNLEYRKVDPERLPLAESLEDARKRHKQLVAAITTTLVMEERAEPRATHVHLRGDFLRTGAAVEPGVPSILPALAVVERRPTRLDLARWLFDASNPLVARVAVNRVWQQYFGRGLVATENDFGTQGDAPTHPELLDWLARWFVEHGWRQKELHRLIVTSATYRQASLARHDVAQFDPDNKLLARQPRLRLEAEIVRDGALAASGLLSPEVGGPSVYPPQPQGIYRFTQQVKYWKESGGDDRYRRGLYTYYWRSAPHPLLVTFDAPDATVACTRRVRSNSPLQALALANDPMFMEMAQALATRVLQDNSLAAGLNDAAALDRARLVATFERCLSRVPGSSELARLTTFLHDQRQRLTAAPADAEKLAPRDLSAELAPAEAAAWTAIARVLLNVDEFIVRP